MDRTLTPHMKRALRELSGSNGDLTWDFEDRVGVNGAARDAVLDGLRRRGMIAADDYSVTAKGEAMLATFRAVRVSA